MIDLSKIDSILQLAVLAAGRNDDAFDRELSRIHLVKCVYFADLAHAQAHNGQGFTGVEWAFVHFGPWAPVVANRIEPAMAAINAQVQLRESRFGKEWTSWSKVSDELFLKQEAALPVRVASAVKRVVRRYGRDTESLLHAAYMTEPMLRAAPGEPLTLLVGEKASEYMPSQPAPLSAKKVKRREARLREIKEEINARLAARMASKKVAPQARAPRYDAVFAEGTEWLDGLAGEEPPTGRTQVEFDDSVWLSDTRGGDPG